MKPHKNPEAALGEAKDQIVSTSVSTKKANKTHVPGIKIIYAASVPIGSCSKP